jgi:hypothetical protein
VGGEIGWDGIVVSKRNEYGHIGSQKRLEASSGSANFCDCIHQLDYPRYAE